MKTIILVWTNKISNVKKDTVNNFWGLGDVIRGTMSMFQLSKKYNFKLIVDIQLHPISNFLKYENLEYKDLIYNNKDNIHFFYPEDVENFVKNDPRELNFFFTNNHLIEDINDDCREFIKNILTPKDDIKLYIDNLFISEKIPLKYNILHFRLGDNVLIRKENIDYQNYINILKENKENNDILMSDSIVFKNIIKAKKIPINLLNTKIVHLGYEYNSEDIKDTLIEFFLTIKANKIKTFTVYRHLSGFVNIAHLIYKIPLEKIN